MKSIILTDFGAPSSPNELEDFLVNLYNRAPTNSEIETATKKYEFIGGSPIRTKIKNLTEGLRNELENVQVDYAFLYNEPYLKDVIESNIKSGINDIKILPLFTFYSRKTAIDISKSISYNEGAVKIKVAPEASKVDCIPIVWGNRLNSDIKGLGNFTLIFIAHSIPKGIDVSNQYLQNFRNFAEKISSRVKNKNFLLGFQSSRQGWLGPSIYDLEVGPYEDVVVVPLSFLLTNMEILYDLDFEYSKYLKEKGYRYMRSGPPDDGSDLPKCLASIV
ncbi:MAG: ferrochelatase [Nitrososphaerota archaeon]|nr:ferrochelatase [Nitrososphaerota archaeon]MDG7038629.1 ferrochelatase [Nitrososphaerota archaeon]